MQKITVGVLAHVDAGKTTLCEAILYRAGVIRRLGRVDHRDTWFDTHVLERTRGITIFSKQATFSLGESSVTLLDTPGHVDFVAETERTLPVLDLAVLVISGSEGVQPHTVTLWRLLAKYRIPTVIFVTKMDMLTPSRSAIMADLRENLSGDCVLTEIDGGGQFTASTQEDVASLDEKIMTDYLDKGSITPADAAPLFRTRKYFPCLFGSGLRTEGIDGLLSLILGIAPAPVYGTAFSAKVYKITRDLQNTRLSHIKLTGGTLRVRDAVRYRDGNGNECVQKITAIRIYSGEKYRTADSISAGDIAAVSGLDLTYAGCALGDEKSVYTPVLEPVMSYRISLPAGCDPRAMMPKLAKLEEEEPLLRIVWDEKLHEIHARIMGEIQIEVLTSLIESRFGVSVSFDEGEVLYKETIRNRVEGVGHFEPLKHYAEVHLVLDPVEPGSGILISSTARTDSLALNWQRLILSNLEEKQHTGVLCGFPLTDVRITLVSGKAHIKHTEGGDFREAALRAVRQGLMQAQSVILEPTYSYTMKIPTETVGRAVGDIRSMSGDFTLENGSDGMTLIKGHCPVSEMQGYASQVASYTGGRGSIGCVADTYRECHDPDAVRAAHPYDPERDLQNPADSVFCRHGAGDIVKWNDVFSFMHLERYLKAEKQVTEKVVHHTYNLDEKALEELMQREFGPIHRRHYGEAAVVRQADPGDTSSIRRMTYILDGYNVLFSWEELDALSKKSLDAARNRLMDIMSDYSSFTGSRVVIVFDAYRSPNDTGKKLSHHGIDVLFTDQGESADAYIERMAEKIGKDENVRVVSSDNLVRSDITRAGVIRMSSKSIQEEVARVNRRIQDIITRQNIDYSFRLGDVIKEEDKEKWQKMLNCSEEQKT